MSDVFLSYKREDFETARSIAEALIDQNLSVWWDYEIRRHERFDERIDAELAQAKCVVVLWSQGSVKSEWVREEADEGKERGVLFPVFIEDIPAPRGFRLHQGTDLTNWDEDPANSEFVTLLHDLREAVSNPRTSTGVGSPVPRSRRDLGEAARRLPWYSSARVVGVNLVVCLATWLLAAMAIVFIAPRQDLANGVVGALLTASVIWALPLVLLSVAWVKVTRRPRTSGPLSRRQVLFFYAGSCAYWLAVLAMLLRALTMTYDVHWALEDHMKDEQRVGQFLDEIRVTLLAALLLSPVVLAPAKPWTWIRKQSG